MSISIIIPIFNSWKYTEKIIKRLILKKHSFNVEIILIDDCSYNLPMKIIQKIKKVENIRIYFLKKNLGPGGARDFGLRKAKGEFIWFIDSDDMPSIHWSNTFEKFKKKNSLVDFVTFPVEIKNLGINETIIYDYSKVKIGEKVLIDKFFGKNFNFDGFQCAAWQFWFKRSFLLRKKIFFVRGKNFEDIRFLSRVFYHSNCFLKMSDICYTHIMRKLSISSSRSNLSPNFEYYKDILRTLTTLLNLTNSPQKYKNINKFFLTRVARYTLEFASILASMKNSKNVLQKKIEINWKKGVSILTKKKIFHIKDKNCKDLYNLFLTVSIKDLINFYFSKDNLPNELLKKKGRFAIHCYSPYSLSWLKILINKNFKFIGFIDTYENGFKDGLSGKKVVDSVKKIKFKPDHIIVINRQKKISKKIIKNYINSGFKKSNLFQIHA